MAYPSPVSDAADPYFRHEFFGGPPHNEVTNPPQKDLFSLFDPTLCNQQPPLEFPAPVSNGIAADEGLFRMSHEPLTATWEPTLTSTPEPGCDLYNSGALVEKVVTQILRGIKHVTDQVEETKASHGDSLAYCFGTWPYWCWRTSGFPWRKR